MNLSFDRWSDPNDLVGFSEMDGIDRDVITKVIRAVHQAKREATAGGGWSVPFSRALRTLRILFGEEVEKASGMDISTGVFRLFLLDMMTECRFVGLLSSEEFNASEEFWTPPRETGLGALWRSMLLSGCVLESIGFETWVLASSERKAEAADNIRYKVGS